MRAAWFLARDVLPKYFSKFSRHDFTVPQLFACLIVKEQQRKGYRDVEALLRDAPHWCRDIGMTKVPDHNPLCRAFHALNLARRPSRLLDRLAQSDGALPIVSREHGAAVLGIVTADDIVRYLAERVSLRE